MINILETGNENNYTRKTKERGFMGKVEEIKRWYTCRREGKTEEYEIYKKSLVTYKKDIERFKKDIVNAERKLEEARAKFPEDSKEVKYEKDQVGRWKQCLDNAMLALKFVRPNSQEDMAYREGISGEDYAKELQEIISPNLDLRFHGTPIYFAEQIIESGGISSTADRYDGYIKSTDMEGEISASTVKTLSRTIDFFSGMSGYIHSLPAGCIFAMYPKDEADANYGPDLLHAVNFKENPEQLFGVFTTPENIEQVTKWMEKAGFQDKSVYTFEGFLEAVKEKSQSMDKSIQEQENIEVNQIKETEPERTTRYLFEEEEAKEIATGKEIRMGRITKLQEKIKTFVKEMRNKFKTENEKEGKDNTNDEPSRD